MIEVVEAAPAQLGECPVWDSRTSMLWSVDIEGRELRRYDPTAGVEDRFAVHGRPGSMALTTDPDVVLVAVEDTIGLFTASNLEWSPLVTVDTGGPANRLNDGALDRQGRFWVGTMHEALEDSSGLLYQIDPDGTFRVEGHHVGIPNGLAFSPDGRTMYYSDSILKTVWSYDYDPDTGNRSNERVLTDFADLPGSPDGGTVDVDGCYWTACVFGSGVARLTPDGDLDKFIELPIETPTKPAFGGPDLSTMFVTSIHTDEVEGTLNGEMIALEVGVSGVREPEFPIG